MLKFSRTAQTFKFAWLALLTMRNIFKISPALLNEFRKDIPEAPFTVALKNTTADEIRVSVWNFWLASVGLWLVLIGYNAYLFTQPFTGWTCLSCLSYVALLTLSNVFLLGFHIARLRLSRLVDFQTFLSILRKKPAICLPFFAPGKLAENIISMKGV